MTKPMNSDRKPTDESVPVVDRCQHARDAIREQLARVIVGQEETIDQMMIAIFTGGHSLLEGVPGLAKTLLVSTLAKSLRLKFSRVQFTPDLMPADITGIDIIEEDRSSGRRDYRFLEGPLFANIILADEINRTPPKTQAALLEAMQENGVTVGRVRHALPNPFFVLATQNPLEQEGTYPLPEAQQDRFMFKILVDYPTFDEEMNIARRSAGCIAVDPEPVLDADELFELQKIVRNVQVGDHVIRYAVCLVRQTRPDKNGIAPQFVRDYLRWGAGPRAVEFLIRGARARAVLHGRSYVTQDDVAALACPVLRHRLGMSFLADSEGKTPDDIVKELLNTTPKTEKELASDVRFKTIFST